MRKIIFGLVCIFWGWSATAESVTVAALGDSLTQGFGLAQADGFVPQLQGWLQDQGADVTVLNAGVSGDTTAGGAARVDWTLSSDVDAMIVALGGNDLLRGLDPEVSRANLEAILQAASKANVAVLLVGMQAPGNYGPDYKASFDAIYPDLSASYGTLLFPSFFEGIGTDPAEVAPLMQSDGIHPNALGVSRIVAAMGPAVLELISAAQSD